ncbi:MAG: complex I NDUFA9 subunit family protein [Nitrospirales bacterium]|nr:complex I NDUFA9 subunit family protein [Nitrospirales bacterium]
MVARFFIAGATGFIGSHLVKALSATQVPCRCLVRSPQKATICSLAAMEVALGDISDRESLRGKLEGCDVLVHLVGIIEEQRGATFESVHVKGTEALVEEARRSGIRHIVYQSALGSSPDSPAEYQRTKAKAEEIVRSSGIPWTIFRPSLVVGPGDGFTEKLMDLISLGPVIPIPGSGNSRFQPLYVGDWVRCFLQAFPNGAIPSGEEGRTFEIGGPEHLTYNEIILQLMAAQGVNKPIVHIPLGIIRAGIPFHGLVQKLGGFIGKRIPSVSKEQLALLQRDNICAQDSVERQFGFLPLTYRKALKQFIPE